MSISKKFATYLSKLNPVDYEISKPVVGTINYLIDSWWVKVDERNSRVPPSIHLPPDILSHCIETWLSCESHKQITLNKVFPVWAKALNSWSFFCLFEGETSSYELIPFLDEYQFKDYAKDIYEFRTQTEILPISLGVETRLPTFGSFFIKKKGSDQRLFVTLDLGYRNNSHTISVRVSSENEALVIQFFADLNASRLANDIYYRQCLTYDRGALCFTPVTNTSWDSLILSEDIKNSIRQNSLGVLNNIEKLNSIGMCPNRNLILISPPGMAKTTTFRAISTEVEGQITRIWCTGKSIEWPEHVTNLFEAARGLSPCLIFIEDMDLFGKDRSISSDSRVLNEFLACLDGSQENAGIVVMASTNDITSMDEALTNRPGRFDTKIEIPYPDGTDRLKMVMKFFDAYNAKPHTSVTKEIVDTIINMTEGLTGDYIKSLVKSAVIRAVSNNQVIENGVYYTADDLVSSAEQVMRGYEIGKRAKKHHVYELETKNSNS